jgi:vacuolar iron transporter family protein
LQSCEVPKDKKRLRKMSRTQNSPDISPSIQKQLLAFQRNEITEYHIYLRLAKKNKSPENQKILEKIAQDELRHAQGWQHYTAQELRPDWLAVWFYYFISRLLGFTFGIKLLEGGEKKIQVDYDDLKPVIPEIETWIQEENAHEQALIGMLDEELLQYAGSVVLGLNDALVELTGALAGLTLALQNTRIIALTGLITGVAAALSMAASEFLSVRSETRSVKKPGRAALYTGIAYIITVSLLIFPYLVLANYYVALAIVLGLAVLIIAAFNYYISVARDEPFRRRFLEMAGISLGVASLSFLLGYLIRQFLGVNV